MIVEYLVFKEYEQNIKRELVQCEVTLAQSLAVVTTAECLSGITGDPKLNKRVHYLLKRMPHIAQVAKHVIAPWWCPAPSDEKDSQNTDGVVDWYQNLAASIEVIKEKRRKAREREAAMTKDEQDEHELDKLAKASEYRIS